jgi:acetoin utilization protein AcuC
VTTASYRKATLLLDRAAHRYADGRWFATGGGGYDAFRVVPRSWALVWLAQAHAEVPVDTPASWRARWAADADDYGQSPPPVALIDPPTMVEPDPASTVDASLRRAEKVLGTARELLGVG